LITSFRDYNIKKGVIVFDRGISSKKNQLDISDLKWKVLCGLPIGVDLKKSLRNVIKVKNILSLKNRVKLNKTIFYVEIVPYSIAGVKGRLAFCFNERKSRELKEFRYDELMHAKRMISEGKEIKEGFVKFFKKRWKAMYAKRQGC